MALSCYLSVLCRSHTASDGATTYMWRACRHPRSAPFMTVRLTSPVPVRLPSLVDPAHETARPARARAVLHRTRDLDRLVRRRRRERPAAHRRPGTPRAASTPGAHEASPDLHPRRPP